MCTVEKYLIEFVDTNNNKFIRSIKFDMIPKLGSLININNADYIVKNIKMIICDEHPDIRFGVSLSKTSDNIS